ncbi:ABC transporter permease [Arthrobacter sp. SX1312]|uniref:ABC transporter permease n=1 Tax=Arthrobacter sp. SX1312 TaxID=2058896 RepID=UPI000CE3629C|nr:ABC transporter permease [Arthrobacter sp. SX1312]
MATTNLARPRKAPASAKSVRPNGKSRFDIRRVGLVIAGYVLLLAVWSFFSTYYFNPYILPTPLAVAEEMWSLVKDGTAFVQFGASIGKITAGFVIGALIGAPIGLLMGRSTYWKNFFQQPLLVLGNVPGLTYAVFALILFGIGAVGPVVAVTLVAIPYVALNVAQGVEEVDPHLVHMSGVYGRNRREIAWSVFLPSIMPYLFAALRYGFAMAWKVEALTEVFGGRSGIGFMIRAEYQEFSVTGVLAWTGFFVLFILIVERVFLAQIENRIFAWRGGR